MNRRNVAAKAALLEPVHGCDYSLGQDALDSLGYPRNDRLDCSLFLGSEVAEHIADYHDLARDPRSALFGRAPDAYLDSARYGA